MSQREDESTKTIENRPVYAVVSDELYIVRLKEGTNEITMNLYEFTLLAEWITKRKFK